VKAVTDDGTLLWSHSLGSDFVETGYNWNTPAIGSDGTIFVCCGGSVYAFHSNGDIKWLYSGLKTERDAKMKCVSITVGPDNMIIAIGNGDAVCNGFNILTNAGVLLWNTKSIFQSTASNSSRNSNINGPNIVVGMYGSIISSSSLGYVTAINKSGITLWSQSVNDDDQGECVGCINTGVSYDPESNTVYATSAHSKYLWAINDITGAVLW
jgi:outer membrane protein assembly factor BamB